MQLRDQPLLLQLLRDFSTYHWVFLRLPSLNAKTTCIYDTHGARCARRIWYIIQEQLVQVTAKNITLQKVYNAKPEQMQLIDQPWQQSLSPSKTKQLLYNCSNPLILTLAYLPLAARFDFLYNFFKPTLWLQSVRVRNMQEKEKKKERQMMTCKVRKGWTVTEGGAR